MELASLLVNNKNMKYKYKVLVAFGGNNVGDIIELTEERAKQLGDKVEKVQE